MKTVTTCITLMYLAGIVVTMATDDTWVLKTDRLPTRDGQLDLRYMASVGNGHLATVVYGPTVYMNGLYNGPQGWSHRAAIPSQHDVTLSVPGEASRTHSLDLWRGVFITAIVTSSVTVELRTYAHQHYTQLLVTEIVVDRQDGDSTDDVTINISRSVINSTVDLVLDPVTEHTDVDRCLTTCYKTRGVTLIKESNRTQLDEVFIYWTDIPDTITLPADTDTNKWTFFTCLDADQTRAETVFQSGVWRLNDAVTREDPDILLDSHVTAWKAKWNQGRIDVGGNEDLSRLVHSSLYYILSSLPSTDPNQPNEQFYGLSPGGLANGANWTDYQGHVFWDMETWMYPPILMMFQGLAKSMLSYRIYGKDPAYARARLGGYEGLRYPWESAATGEEQTPDICPACRENQQHITGDIALAARQYVAATRDVDWLRKDQGYSFIRDMARFWKTRPTWNERKQAYEINGVMPPDEHAIYINNSIYTNIGARQSIRFARYAACLTGLEKYDEVGSDWLEVADKLYIPYDDERKYHPEYEGYDFTKTVNDSNIVKQADVILLGYPLMYDMVDEVRRNDLTIYENVTDPMGPAMTWSMFAINWLELGDKVKAADMFRKSYSLYTREPFKVWTEARSGIGAVNFITGMGGFLQAVVFGYAGARLHTENLDFDPQLPANSTSLRLIGLDYLGNSFDLNIYESRVILVVQNRSENLYRNLRLRLKSTGTEWSLQKGLELRLPREAFSIYTTEVTDCPLPEGSSCPPITSSQGNMLAEVTPLTSGRALEYAVISQTGGDNCTDHWECSKRVRQLMNEDRIADFYVGGDGRVYEGRGWNKSDSLDLKTNLSTFSISVVGDFTCSPPSHLVERSVRHLLKCAVAKNFLTPNFTLISGRQTQLPVEFLSDHDRLTCRLMKNRHWRNYQRGGEFTSPKCEGECFKPIIKPPSQYEDLSQLPTVFQTDTLPRKDGSTEIDFRYMASVGNGHIATIVYSPTIYMNGLYNGPTGWSHRARIPSTQALTVNISGVEESKVQSLYSLDVKRAVFEERIVAEKVKVVLRVYAHQFYTRLLVSEVQIERLGDNTDDVTVRLANNPGTDSTDLVFRSETDVTGDFRNCFTDCFHKSGVTLIPESNETDLGTVHIYRTGIQQEIVLSGSERNKTLVFFSSIDMFDEYARDTFQKALDLLKEDVSALYNSHTEAWTKRWGQGVIELDGDTYLSKRIYGSFYYLLSFLPAYDPYIRNNQFYGLSPGGLANGANWTDYQGHVFWDMETWMYPTMLMFHPELGKAMLSYRTYAMGPARQRAAQGGYQGIRFPWESALTGVEQTPDICVPCRENQLHITGDIGLAAKQYVAVTRDVDWLTREKGLQMIRDMAQFWASRPTKDEDRDTYSVNGVMPPDEHAQSINNSVYTNVGAKLSIYFARYAACLAGGNSSADIPESWMTVADKLHVPFNEKKQYHPEFEGFENWTDERGVKQADAIMLGYPQMWPMTEEVRRNDLVEYEKVTNPLGPAMTWGMFAIGWLELGDEHKANELFHKSYSLYVREPFKIWTEARSGIGAVNFITGMGGFLQALFYGYGGARIYTEHMEFEPRVPPGNKALKFLGVNYLGNSLDIEIYPKKVIVTNREASQEYPIVIRMKNTGAEMRLEQGKEVVANRAPFSIRTLRVTNCPLPKDEILRGKNCPTVISRATWQADHNSETERMTSAASVVIVDHTSEGTCSDFSSCVESLHSLQRSHLNQGHSDIVYNFLIGEDGRLYEGRGWDVVSGIHSNVTLSIGLVGNFKCKMPNMKMLETLHRLLKCGLELGKLKRDYRLRGGMGPYDRNTVPLAIHCKLRSWSNWWSETDEWESYCVKPCDETMPTLPGVVRDVSEEATVYTAERLPKKQGTDEIDFRFMPSVGNGHLATVALSPTVYVNGLYNGPTGWSHRARIPSLNSLHLTVRGVTGGQMSRSYSLDVMKATFTETVETPDVTITQRVYAHQYYVRLLVTEVMITRKAGSDGREVVVNIVNNHQDNFTSEDLNFETRADLKRGDLCPGWRCWRTKGRTLIPERENTSLQDIYIAWYEIPDTVTLAGNVTTDRWAFMTAIDQTVDRCHMNFEAGRRDYLIDKELLFDRHVRAWKTKWESGHIEIKDNLQLSKLVYGSFYYILSSLPSEKTYLPTNQFYGLSPGGLANGANWTDYQGHVFWDMETWMYPGILMFHPNLAKAMLSYRIYAMPPSYDRARSGGYEGLRYPWEGASSGAEVTPDICVPCRENQQHITGDIAFAARQYVSATRDMLWLKNEKGFEFIRDMGKFWVTRPSWNEEKQAYEINGVMPPDEHQISINNSVYTNVGAKLSIHFANYASCLIGESVNYTWAEVADKIYLPFDEYRQYHPEFEGYESATGEKAIVKQADAILLGFPQMWPMDPVVRKNDLDMYEKVTTPLGPAMTWGMFNIGWLELEDEDKAKEMFHKSYSLYTREPFKIWTEARSGIGAVNFITGMGGFLQSVLFGYGGVRLHVETLDFDPRIIPGTSGMRLVSLNYLGCSLDIDISKDKVRVVKTLASQHDLELIVRSTGQRFGLMTDNEIIVPREAFTIRGVEPTECPLPEGRSCPSLIRRIMWGSRVSLSPVKRTSVYDKVVVSQTDGKRCQELTTCKSQMQGLQGKHLAMNYSDIGYNFLVDDDGNVYEGRGWDAMVQLDGEYKENSLVIGFLGDYTCAQPSKRALASLKRLLKCGIETERVSAIYKLLSERQVKNFRCNTPTCSGDHLICAVKTWRHWSSEQVGGEFRAPDCEDFCLEPTSTTQTTSDSQYTDISVSPDVFRTDRLPMKDNSNEIDFRYMASVGNGHLATLVKSDTVYVNGLYNGPKGWSHRARIPAVHALTVSPQTGAEGLRVYSLNVKQGVFEEELTMPFVKVIQRTYAHQYFNRLLVTEVIIQRTSGTGDIVFDVNNNHGDESEDILFHQAEDYISSSNKYQRGTTRIPEIEGDDVQEVHVFFSAVPTTLTLKSGQVSTNYRFFMSVDLDMYGAKNNFDEILRIQTINPDSVYAKHVDLWQAKWSSGRIDLDGNVKLSKLINSCFYYLMSFLPAMDTFLPNRKFGGLSPGGLANGANWTDYQGHVFWDMETWMYPTMLMFHPELAEQMLSYRINSMKPAYDRATAGGYEGLRYPWESARTGVEVTPDICPACRENQQHITGDIALAARQYVAATRDVDWLNVKNGYIFIKDMARFWKSRPSYNATSGLYDINGVMPPDEHAEYVNNSVYTNVGAKLAINFARYAACLSGRDAQQEVPDEWLNISRKITLLFDEKQNFHPEYAGYTDENDPRGVKQADVVLLSFPQMWPMSDEVRRNDLIRYERVNNPLGPAMTWGMFSIAWLQLGDEAQAADMFERSYGLYYREPFKIWTEARAGIGAVNFLTGMGGFLQAVFFGYGGARLHTERIDFDPRLPPDTRGMRFVDFNYLGNHIDMEIKPDHVSLLVKSTKSMHNLLLTVKKNGAIFRLREGKEFLMTRQAFSLQSQQVTDCPLPEEKSCPQIVSRRSWPANDEQRDERHLDHVTKVVLHQTGGAECETLDDCKRRVHNLQDCVNCDANYSSAFNFFVGRDGRVYEGRGWGRVSEKEEEETSALSVALIGDFTCTPPDVMHMHAAMRLIKCAVENGFLSENYEVLFESQTESPPSCSSAQCPGDKLFCRVQQMKHWISKTATSRLPDCKAACVVKRTSFNLYPDTGSEPHRFETDRLPLSPGTDKPDFRYMASVANGHLGTVVYSDTIYVNGLYNGPFGWSHRARIPSTQAIRVQIDGDPSQTHHYVLDTERAMFEETVTGGDVRVLVRTYAHQKHTRLLITEVRAQRLVESQREVSLSLSNNRGEDSDDIAFSEPQPYNGDWFRTGTTKQTETDETPVANVVIYYTDRPDRVTLQSDVQSETWIFFSAIDKIGQFASRSFDTAREMVKRDKDSLYESHIEAWSKRWSRGRVLVEDNLHLSKLINGCFYYLLSFLPAFDPELPNNQFYGLSPGGLANGANWTDYQGHVFWDMETWMYPGILVFHPELAKDMLSYRIYGMSEAYKRAQKGGYEGLRFPWESAFTGAEQTPEICVPCRENQQHITGDIALAARQYLTMTRDMPWLREDKGFQFIRDMGKFWTSRVEWNEGTKQYDISGVMPPDEHAINVTNSVYTNVGAKLSIHFARYASCLSNRTDGVGADWAEIADTIALPFDEINKVHPEYQGYRDGDDDRGVKQADVILMGYPQMWPIDPVVRRNDLIKYEKVTNVMGPAMTWGMFSIGWLELGEVAKAEDLFHRSYRAYVREPFRVWTEARAGIGAVNFITGMGGFLQAVVFGYGGLRIHTEHLSFNPRVLPDSKGLIFEGLDYLGNTLDIRIKPDFVSVVNRRASPSFPLILQVDKTEALQYLLEDKEVLLSRQPFNIRTTELSDCPLPEESSCPKIVTRSEWGSQSALPRGTLSTKQNVVIYQTGTEACSNKMACIQVLQDLQKSLQEADKRINHNFVIGTDGRVYEGLGWKTLRNDAGGLDRKEIDIGVIGDFTHTSPSDVVLTQIRRVIKCGMETNKIAPNYTLLWEKQVAPSTCTSCNGDKLLCRLMNFGHWGDHQEGGVFIKPRCDETVPTTPPHGTQKPQPPSSATEAVSTHHLIQSICFIIYIFHRYVFS